MISENLELLKKLDPELWKMIQSSYPIPEKRDWEHPGKEEIDKWQIDVKYAIEDSIQGCLQRAIEANGWVFEVEGKVGIDDVYPPTAGYIAGIYKLAEGYDGDYFNPRHKCLLNESVADSPADALLAAYIEAIQ